MKITLYSENREPTHPQPLRGGELRCGQLAFTLVEVLIAMSIMLMVVAGILYVQSFGMRLFQLTNSKLGASAEARRALGLLTTEIRSAKIVRLGNVSGNNFVEAAPDTPQQGNAIQLYLSTNTNSFIRYFRDTNSTGLKRMTSGITGASVVADYVTNYNVFAAEDAFGNTLTNNQKNGVISLKLQFYQIQYPITRVGPGNYYDYYQLTTKITPRALE
jgi:type II secretory pathway component PulJ